MLKYIKYCIITLSSLLILLVTMFVLLQNDEVCGAKNNFSQNYEETSERSSVKIDFSPKAITETMHKTVNPPFPTRMNENVEMAKRFDIDFLNENFEEIVETAKKYKKMYDEITRLI